MKKVRSRDGTAIAFDRIGDGKPVILVLGAFNLGAQGAPLAQVLSSQVSVFSYDRRGRGESGDTPPYAVGREVEDLAAVVGEAGGSAMVFGHSSGAALALEAARTLPITKLALYEPPFIVDDSRSPIPTDYVAQLREMASTGPSRRCGRVLHEHGGTGASRDGRRDATGPGVLGVDGISRAHAFVRRSLMGDTMSGKPLPAERWSTATMPTLVMNGSKNPPYQKNSVQALAALLPSAKQRTLGGQDHGAAPEVLAPVLKEFFG